MADSYSTLNGVSVAGGDSVDMESVTYGGAPTTRKRTRTVITGTAAAAIADVVNSSPSESAYGLPVRLAGVAHDSADAGTPTKIGGKASDTEPTAVAAADRTNAWFDRRGAQQIIRRAPRASQGMYCAYALIGTMNAGLAADSEIFQVRWTSSALSLLIRRITLTGFFSRTTAFAAGSFHMQCKTVDAWTVDGSGGGAVSSGDAGRLRPTMNGSEITASGAIRYATTVALGAGTKTTARLVGHVLGDVPNALGNHITQPVDFFNAETSAEPLVLTQNCGFIVTADVPATGTWRAGIRFEWAETEAY